MAGLRKAATLAVGALGVLPGLAQAGTVAIVHGIPGFRADIYLNGKRALSGFGAGAMAPVHLAPGSYHVAIRSAGAAATSKPALSTDVRIGLHSNITLLAHLDTHGHPALTAYRNDAPHLLPGRAQLVVRPAAAAPRVDVVFNHKRIFRNVTSPMSLGRTIRPGTYSLAFVRSGTQQPIWGPTNVTFRAGKAYFVYAVGSLQSRTLDQLVETLSVRSLPPAGVPAGNSGLAAPAEAGAFDTIAAPGKPAVPIVLMAGAALAAAAAGLMLMQTRRAR